MHPESASDDRKHILEHVIELRSKLFISLTALMVGATVAHIYHEAIIRFILKPVGDQQLVFLSPLDSLFFILKTDLLVGLFLSFPILAWSILSFIRPALAKSTRSALYIAYTTSILLLAAGLAYAYFITVPLSLRFLYSITIPGITNTITAQSYLSFVLTQSLILALIFQIPIIILAGIYIRVFTIEWLTSKRRYVYLLSIIALAVLTPTADLFNLGIVLLPTLVMFEVSVLAGRVVNYFVFKRRVMKNEMGS